MLAPEPVLTRPQARAGLGKLERTDDAPPVVRVHGLGGLGIALDEECVGALAAELVVEALQPLALAGRRRGRQLELRQGGAQVEARAADDDRRSPLCQSLVDRGVR